ATACPFTSWITSPRLSPASAAGVPGSTPTTTTPLIRGGSSSCRRSWGVRSATSTPSRARVTLGSASEPSTRRSDGCSPRTALGFLQAKGSRYRRRYRLNHDAEPAAHNLSLLDDPLHHLARHVDGYSEANPLVAAAARQDGGVDADQGAPNVHQGAAGVTGVD